MQTQMRLNAQPRKNIDAQDIYVRVYDSLLMSYCLSNIWTAVWCHQTMASNCINHSKQQDLFTNNLFQNTKKTLNYN